MSLGAPLTPPGSPTPSAPPLSCTAYPHPNWFIQRDNGAYVPVIPADELPPEVELEGAPRSFKMDEAQGMKFLGEMPYSAQTYSLAHSQRVVHRTTDSWNKRHAQHHYTNSQTSLRPLMLSASARPSMASGGIDGIDAPDRETGRGHSRTQSDISMITTQPTKPPRPPTPTNPPLHGTIRPRPLLPPSGREPDPGRKEYCTYWIKTGQCDFTQQGCLFKHEMPDLATLREKVGVGSVPHWYQARTAMARRRARETRSVGETPRWLVERTPSAESQDGSGSDDGEGAGGAGAVRRKMLLPAPPAASTGTTRANAVPARFRAPDDGVRRSAKRLLEREREKVVQQRADNASSDGSAEADDTDDEDHQDMIDLSTPTTASIDRDDTAFTSLVDLAPPKKDKAKALNRKAAVLGQSAEHPHPTTSATALAPPRQHRRSISDAQTDILNLLHPANPPSPKPSAPSAAAADVPILKLPSRRGIPQMKRYCPPSQPSPLSRSSTATVTATTSSTATPSAIPTPTRPTRIPPAREAFAQLRNDDADADADSSDASSTMTATTGTTAASPSSSLAASQPSLLPGPGSSSSTTTTTTTTAVGGAAAPRSRIPAAAKRASLPVGFALRPASVAGLEGERRGSIGGEGAARAKGGSSGRERGTKVPVRVK